jgi:predicted Zn-dependent protease
MAKGQLAQMLAVATGVAASDTQDHARAAAAAAQIASQMILLSYSREDELEADEQGLKFMANSGYDPEQMIKVMEVLKSASRGHDNIPGFLSSHPHPDDRMTAIRKFIKTEYPSGVPPNLAQGNPLPR